MQKRLSKLALLAVAAAFIVAGFPACSDEDEGEPPAPVALEKILVKDTPTKRTYQVDEDFDPTGLVITEVYNNNTTTDVPYTEANNSDFKFDFDFSVANTNVTVTVTYKEKTADFTVSVTANKPDPDKELASIAVKANPAKLTYTVGDTTIDPDGLVITVTYTDNTTDDITYSEANKDDFKFNFDFSTAKDDVTVTVTYKEKTATFAVSVTANEPDSTKTIASIAVKTKPTKLAYIVGETIDPDGLVITVTYTDNTTDSIGYGEANKDDFKFDFDSSKADDNVTVTVTYKEKTATFIVSVAAKKELTSIAVKTKPTKLAYTVNETFDPAGLVITAKYSNDSTEDITYSEANKADFDFKGFDSSKADDNVTVTVTYKEKTATFTVSVKKKGTEPTPEKTLTSIAVKTAPTKTAYTVGDDFEPAGLVITAKYSNDSTEDITYSEANKADFDFKGFDASAASDSVTVTVTYKEKTATFTVSVAEAEKSLFETLSAQDNNVLKEDFAAFTVSKFGAGFGKVGVYGDDGVTVADGAISTGAAGTIRNIYVDFGLVKESVEGCVTVKIGGSAQENDNKPLLTFFNGDSAVLTINTGTGAATANTVSLGEITGTYEIYYKFDLAAKTVSVTVNGKAVLTGSTLTADSVSGYTIKSHNKGNALITADDIAVCATKGDLGTYKAQVKAWLASLVANSYTKDYTMNKNAVDQAKSNGDSAIDGAADVDAVLAAYGDAKTALGKVNNDLAQTKENACTELDAYFPEGKTADSYTEDQLAAVGEAKATGKTAINAATSVEAVNTALAEAKAKIDALPDNSATAYTVTVKDSDGNDLGTVTAYTTVESVLDEIKKLITDPTKVIAGGKLYSNKECTTEYDTATELTGDVTVYVTLEEKKTTTYVLPPDMLGTSWTSPASGTMTPITTDGVMFKAGNNVTYDNSSKNLPTGISAAIKTGGSLQKNGKNSIVFTTNGPSTVTMEFFSTSSTSERTAGYVEGTDTSPVSNNAWTGSAIGGSVTVKEAKVIYTETFNIEKAGTYSLGGSNGISITKITVTVEE